MQASILKNFAGLGIRLVVLSVLLLGMAGVCMAQSPTAPAQSATKAEALAAVQEKATPATIAPEAKSAAQTGQTAVPEKPAAKGTQEGIKVHGHWTIEVRNPDGKLVSHTEFENSLASNGGATLLAGLLSRTASAGSWGVTLIGSDGISYVFIYEPNSLIASKTGSCPPTSGYVASCSGTLTLSGSTVSGGTLSGPTVTMTGSATAPAGFPATINYVTTNDVPCPASTAPTACFNAATGLSEESLTSANLSTPVSVTAGQTVAVTVVISFQ